MKITPLKTNIVAIRGEKGNYGEDAIINKEDEL